MKLFLNPKDYGFHESVNYPEIHECFGVDTFVKTIASHDTGKEHHYWYVAIQVPSKNFRMGDERYTIMQGAFSKGQMIKERNYPRTTYQGLISSSDYAENLLKNLMGTTENKSVEVDGKERLAMQCSYMSQKLLITS